MKSEITIMLTHNDFTVKNALEVFESCKDLPVSHWGFKDVGISVDEMIALNKVMKSAGKKTFLEVVTYTEEECLDGARLACKCGCDYLTGGRFYPSVLDEIKGAIVKYFPFCGDVGGSPVSVKGTIEEVVSDSRRLLEAGADGVDLAAYRTTNGYPISLAKAVLNEVGAEKIIIAGSIDSEERIDLMDSIGAFTYTIGSALFDLKFVKNGSFRDNLEHVIKFRSERR